MWHKGLHSNFNCLHCRLRRFFFLREVGKCAIFSMVHFLHSFRSFLIFVSLLTYQLVHMFSRDPQILLLWLVFTHFTSTQWQNPTLRLNPLT